MNNIEVIKKIATNDLSKPSASIFKLGPQYQPKNIEERLKSEPISMIIGEHPSKYSVSPLMWNAEYNLTARNELFLPVDIPAENTDALIEILQLALEVASTKFRVLTITNPFKLIAFDFFAEKAKNRQDIIIEDDARRIGATNQILIGPDNVFHVINSDGRGMLRSIDSHLSKLHLPELTNGPVALIGAGGAARGIADVLTKRLNEANGELNIFNRTLEKAEELIKHLSEFFPKCKMSAYSLSDLEKLAHEQAVIVSAITKGDPLLENNAFAKLTAKTLVVDANYGDNSLILHDTRNNDISSAMVRDGSGMVVEGYIIPSRQIADLWGKEIPNKVYQEIGKLFGYQISL